MKTLDELRPGLMLGRYEFLLPIARGGMATVWTARVKGARGFQKVVAIKTMLPSLSADPDFEQMFLAEADIASRIRHPNVVEIMDLGEDEGLLYLVMPWVDGEPLSAIMRAFPGKDKQLPTGICAKIIGDICAGLQAAHDLVDEEGHHIGLVHRDVSPQNIMVGYDGVPRLVDFGVAKAARGSVETVAGQIKGKVQYLAPEQVRGEPVDGRTDVFSAGIVLYQMTAGKHPFRGENDTATLHNLLTRQVPMPHRLVPYYPRKLEAVVMRALQKEPNKRFPTALEMSQALDDIYEYGGKRTSNKDIAVFLSEIMGSGGKAKRESLRVALQQADTRIIDTARLLEHSTPAVDATPASGAMMLTDTGIQKLEQMTSGAISLDQPNQPTAEPASGGTGLTGATPAVVPKPKRWGLGAGLAVLIVVVIAVVIAEVAPRLEQTSATEVPVVGSAPVAESVTPPSEPTASGAPETSSSAVAPGSASAEPSASASAPAPQQTTRYPRKDRPDPKSKDAGTQPKSKDDWTPKFKDPGF